VFLPEIEKGRVKTVLVLEKAGYFQEIQKGARPIYNNMEMHTA